MTKHSHLLPDHEIDRTAAALRPHLNAAIDRIDDDVKRRLAAARARAVAARAERETKPVIAPVAVGNGQWALPGDVGRDLRGRLSDWRFWATGLVVGLLIALYGAHLWRDHVASRDAVDVDLMILGDDVPVDALLDRGFSHFVREGE